MGKQIYNGVTVISHDNISITGQDQEKTKLWNKPEVEGISYTSTFFVKNTSGFYVQDMTLQNAFDYKNSITKQGAASAQAARAVVLRDRGYKTIMKNVTMDSWQDTYYSNLRATLTSSAATATSGLRGVTSCCATVATAMR